MRTLTQSGAPAETTKRIIPVRLALAAGALVSAAALGIGYVLGVGQDGTDSSSARATRPVVGTHATADAVTESLALKRRAAARASRATTGIRLERVR